MAKTLPETRPQSVTLKNATFNKDKTRVQVTFMIVTGGKSYSQTTHLEKQDGGWWRDKYGMLYDFSRLFQSLQPKENVLTRDEV